jgi:signal transduction histidine kinase
MKMLLKHWANRLVSMLTIILVLAVFLAACSQTGTTLSNEESNNRMAKATTHVAAVGLGETLKGVMDENLRIDLIQKFIDPIRFFDDQTGYFYVYNYNCINIAHAVDKTLVGKDLTQYKDTKGKFVIQELSAAAKKGGGFVEYYWPHPQTKQEVRKIGYVEPIPDTDYFIGTGYYPDTR